MARVPRPRSDAFVFFGATGDLAFKQIFPALATLIADEAFDLPIIGVARSGDLDSLRTRAQQSLETHGAIDPAAAARLVAALRYVKGSDEDVETFHALRRELGEAKHPLRYLIIPPALFGQVIPEKPFGRLLERDHWHDPLPAAAPSPPPAPPVPA